MKTLFAAAAATGLAIAATPALADDHKADKPVVVERTADGKATKVSIEGKVYDVCMSEAQDSCINPRAAGLNWGDRPLGYWPGERSRS